MRYAPTGPERETILQHSPSLTIGPEILSQIHFNACPRQFFIYLHMNMYYAYFRLTTFVWFFMSTRFGTCVSHSAYSIVPVVETGLDSIFGFPENPNLAVNFFWTVCFYLLLYCSLFLIFFELYTFIILTSTLVLGINYFVIIARPLHPMQVRKMSSSSCYMIETYEQVSSSTQLFGISIFVCACDSV